jgi:hypothetical protein
MSVHLLHLLLLLLLHLQGSHASRPASPASHRHGEERELLAGEAASWQHAHDERLCTRGWHGSGRYG